MSIPEKIINIMSVYIIMFCPSHFNVYLTNMFKPKYSTINYIFLKMPFFLQTILYNTF